MTKVVNPLISNREERFLNFVATCLFRFLHPDLATFIAVLASLVAFAFYVLLEGGYGYLLCNVALFVHYIFDGVDGKIARLRNLGRKNGWLIDKASDYVSSCFFVSGFFYASVKSVFVVCLVLAATTFVHCVHGYYQRKGYEVKLGGTESRVVLSVLNLVMWVMTLPRINS
ncbi:MAG: CDP-alcohol phosphatidyltransferase family protein [Candidatus Bathyarchaeota archaeon]|nr:CDP-alcohol phosphatidyltransferase family protein [Candidatus Bathyarchaeota archaeon]MDW8022401.1 CDP-alcohol phosphatidyltransferase family protein [Nitrososphaerota archaeon]